MIDTLERDTVFTRLPAALLAASIAATALTSCSEKSETPNENAITEAPVPSTAKKINGAQSVGKILFAANTAAKLPHDIYEKDLHTGKVTNITNTPDTDELNPQISPDHKQAVYTGAKNKGNYQIYRIDLGTQKITQLTNHDANDFDPTYTPDGDILYKSNVTDGYGDIWKMTGEGGNPHNLTPHMPQTEEWKPTAVGDDLIVFTSRHADDGSMSHEQLSATDNLMLLNTRTNDEPTRLTNNNWADWYSEADPTHPGVIAFTSKAASGGPDTIYKMNVTQPDAYKQREQLTDPKKLPGDSSDCSWANDGTLLFVNNANGRYEAMARTSDGTYIAVQSMGGDVLSPVAEDKIKIH